MPPISPSPELLRLVGRLPQPQHQLIGRVAPALVMPDNIVCFQRRAASDLNRPRRGRALHHRFVLIFALRTAVTVCVDDQEVRLHAGEGLLVFPFQFHHYTAPQREALAWLFVTFDLAEVETLEALRCRPFALTPVLQSLAADLVAAYEADRAADLPVLLLGLLLARLRRLEVAPHPAHTAAAAAPGLIMRVNQLANRSRDPLGIREMARALGISPSHLRARFRASCGVSIGRHLRRLRLERASGLLRLGPQRVSEIAEACGFSSIYSFSRAFRVAYGQSPLAFRHSGQTSPHRRRGRGGKD